jgi:mannose-6-phosphate isomerase-like protein (cupin superfamily)
MKVVTEVISGEPFDRPERVIERDEARLFEAPPEAAMRFLESPLQPLAIYAFPAVYAPVEFARPQGVFEGDTLRLEWQTINGRQPFYHRNADVDEIGYQICGERTLMTECGTIEFRPGQFSRIPVGVAHDNYGREDIHLIFYLHGPAERGIEPVGHGEHRVPPFPGWQARPMVEVLTDCLGGPNCAIAYSMADEEMILNTATRFHDPLEVLEPKGPAGETEWIYRAPKVWIGHTRLERTEERHYRRRICADEIQYQAEGSRTIISQRGVVTLNPGEFTCIPKGCAYASIAEGLSKHLSVLTCEPVPPAKEPARAADPSVSAWLAAHDRARLEAVR